MIRLLVILLLCLAQLSVCNAQTVTKTHHSKAVKTDQVSTGTLTIRKPAYVCISTDGDKDQLIMDGTQFTMTRGGRKHVTDSKKNAQFATFQAVLTAVINGQPIPAGDDISTVTKGGQQIVTITPTTGKKRQMFTSFVLTIDSKSSTFRLLRMNERNGGYTEYVFK